MNSITATSEDEFKAGGYFPFEYYAGFLKYVKENPVIQVVTYADLAWCEPRGDETIYQAEHNEWLAQLESGARDPRKIYLLIQHDVDSRPERTMRAVREEMALGVPSNVMIFLRRHNRKQLKNNGTLQFTDYELEAELLRQAEQEQGFVIGYHCNAYEQAFYDLPEAQQRMSDDIAGLRKEYQIKFWSAHGGVPGENGLNNNKIVPPGEIARELIWVHNGASPHFDGNYSDGGPNNRRINPDTRNLSKFASTWKPGKRYRILTHPQYYNSPPRYNEWLATAQWYRDMYKEHEHTGNGGWKSPAIYKKRNLFGFFRS